MEGRYVVLIVIRCLNILENADAYLELCQASIMELYGEIVNGF